MQRHPDVHLHGTEILLRSRIFDIVREQVELPSGLRQDLVIVDHPGAVCIAPVLPDGRLLLVRQYRHATGEWLVEIPAGRLEEGETPEAAAARELEEETGHQAGSLALLRTLWPAPGFCSEAIRLFLARDLVALADGGRPADEDEELELVRWSPQEVLARCADAKTLAAAALVLSERQP